MHSRDQTDEKFNLITWVTIRAEQPKPASLASGAEDLSQAVGYASVRHIRRTRLLIQLMTVSITQVCCSLVNDGCGSVPGP
jgi:hypothetical protein